MNHYLELLDRDTHEVDEDEEVEEVKEVDPMSQYLELLAMADEEVENEGEGVAV